MTAASTLQNWSASSDCRLMRCPQELASWPKPTAFCSSQLARQPLQPQLAVAGRAGHDRLPTHRFVRCVCFLVEIPVEERAMHLRPVPVVLRSDFERSATSIDGCGFQTRTVHPLSRELLIAIRAFGLPSAVLF